ncbi:kazal-like serine protease inhibitor domain and phox-like domain-containing protein [Plasmopara halstedii]|uniref:Kazal-like serine protease inhibitor domain and phox-like domain-containing protein n=1 Tax=Plasmopara halstedii TaxID=4781 RepID=A0A0P1AKR5_PLAHL|nr:kazal-like serine protease inhibitor domain and phox-like domain-containing protein [Plasmopara halstedii]CEG41529.1 kazal-like serine protease inhibitor domain and phox-like domain-containing protein [Plasmopara halstedii]|eukprot:XP_024577898.1 kazal-like serine protease inhibitor domain and phox-like domain-containing protein [Plasmopara halstedii]
MTKQILEWERETKRIKLIHTTPSNTHCAPVQRRLQKIINEFQPASYRLQVQACWLCVGMSVVYRVSIILTIINPFTFGTTSGLSTAASNGGRMHRSSRVISMSHSKFCQFYAQVSTVLRCPAVVERLSARKSIRGQGAIIDWQPFAEFLQKLTEVFQRYKYFQYLAFTAQADAKTIKRSKVQLEAFLSDCWYTLVDILPLLVVEPYLLASLGSETISIYLLMRDFLSLPETILDANFTYANAVLILDDVSLSPSYYDHSCSICLEPLILTEVIELSPNDKSCSNSCVNQACSNSCQSENTSSVKLPCAHIYHEDCIMSWMQHNPSCPECRAVVVKGI